MSLAIKSKPALTSKTVAVAKPAHDQGLTNYATLVIGRVYFKRIPELNFRATFEAGIPVEVSDKVADILEEIVQETTTVGRDREVLEKPVFYVERSVPKRAVQEEVKPVKHHRLDAKRPTRIPASRA